MKIKKKYIKTFLAFAGLVNLLMRTHLKAQHTINYLATSNGASIPSGGGGSYFGPSLYPFNVMGSCGTGGYDWIHGLCSETPDFPTISKKTYWHVSTWNLPSGNNTGYMVVDMGQARTFNELRVFQAFADGKVTHVKMYVHPDTSGLAPIHSNVNWTALFTETTVGTGTLSGTTVSNPTVISFADQTARFVKFEFRNDGRYGDPSFIELRELKLFYDEPGFSPNYLSTFLSGAIIPTHPDSFYFGPAGVEYGGVMGTCGVGSFRWIHSLCDEAPNSIWNSEKISTDQGSTWHAGGGANTGYMIVDLGQVRTFNELRVFQMLGIGANGKVTHARMYTHPNTTGSAPFAGDAGWVPAFSEKPIDYGQLSGAFVNDPTIIDFSTQSSRFVKLTFRNDGTHGDPNYIEVRSVKLYHKTSPPLPVELLSFTATPISEENKVLLHWSTASEKNNDYFVVERSKDGIEFRPIGRIKGAGKSNAIIDYKFTDEAPLTGVSYYRVKQIDYDGTFKYTGIRAVQLNNNSNFVVYPNPVKDHLTIQLGGSHPSMELMVYNVQGQQVHQSVFSTTVSQVDIDFSDHPKGLYVLKLIGENTFETYRMVKK